MFIKIGFLFVSYKDYLVNALSSLKKSWKAKPWPWRKTYRIRRDNLQRFVVLQSLVELSWTQKLRPGICSLVGMESSPASDWHVLSRTYPITADYIYFRRKSTANWHTNVLKRNLQPVVHQRKVQRKATRMMKKTKRVTMGNQENLGHEARENGKMFGSKYSKLLKMKSLTGFGLSYCTQEEGKKEKEKHTIFPINLWTFRYVYYSRVSLMAGWTCFQCIGRVISCACGSSLITFHSSTTSCIDLAMAARLF